MISVIVPVYNNEQTLELAVWSVQQQTHKDLEIIIVDDHSTDGSVRMAQRLADNDSRIVLCQADRPEANRFNPDGVNINAGYQARNTGLERARGEWITFQDADDMSLLNRLDVQLLLAQRFSADHLTTSCFWFEQRYIGCALDLESFEADHALAQSMCGTQAIRRLARDGRGWLSRCLPDSAFGLVPFAQKHRRAAGRSFFGHWNHYPGVAGCPLLRREAIGDIRFRPLDNRRWPSIRGRGADRDFNYHLVYRGARSISVDVPLYAWRTPSPFTSPYDLDRYVVSSKAQAKGEQAEWTGVALSEK